MEQFAKIVDPSCPNYTRDRLLRLRLCRLILHACGHNVKGVKAHYIRTLSAHPPIVQLIIYGHRLNRGCQHRWNYWIDSIRNRIGNSLRSDGEECRIYVMTATDASSRPLEDRVVREPSATESDPSGITGIVNGDNKGSVSIPQAAHGLTGRCHVTGFVFGGINE